MSLLRSIGAFLLGLPLRFQYVPVMYVGKYVGDVVQRDYLAMSGLRRLERFRQSMTLDTGRPEFHFLSGIRGSPGAKIGLSQSGLSGRSSLSIRFCHSVSVIRVADMIS